MADRLVDLITAFYEVWNYDPTGDTPARALAAALREHVVLREDLEQVLNEEGDALLVRGQPVYRIRESPRIHSEGG